MNVQYTRGGVVLLRLAIVVGVLTLGHGCAETKDTATVQNTGDTTPADTLPASDGGTGKAGDTANAQQPSTGTQADTGNGNQPSGSQTANADDGKKPLTLPASNYGGTKFILADDIEFMGSKAKGKRICIIADKSNSMKAPFVKGAKKTTKDGRAIDFLKAELRKTLKKLSPEQEFFIIFFDAAPEPMPGGHWHKSKDADMVLPWIDNVELKLGTKPLPAFKVAFKLDPRPDVIFFMTDGEFKNILPDLDKLNHGTPKVVINTIQLQAARKLGEPGVAQLQQMALRAGGTFTLINALNAAK